MNTTYTPHKIIRECSPRDSKEWGKPGWGEEDDIFYVTHYLGSYEMATSRPSDVRGEYVSSRWIFDANKTKGHILDDARPWLQGFVAHFGEPVSHYLLDDVGFPYNASTALRVFEKA